MHGGWGKDGGGRVRDSIWHIVYVNKLVKKNLLGFLLLKRTNIVVAMYFLVW